MIGGDKGRIAKRTTPDTAHRRRFLKETSIAAAGIVAGCTDDQLVGLEGGDGSTAPADAGASGDASLDAGHPVDTGPPPDSGFADSGAPDSGDEDAGEIDAGEIDAGAADAEVHDDATVFDAGDDGVPLSDRFPLGIASGDVTSDAAILWTRYIGNETLHLVVRDVTGAEHVDEEVTVGGGDFVHAEVTGLNPGAAYVYTFYEVSGMQRAARSEIGRFRAAIADEVVEPLVIGACCCTANGRRMETLERAGARTDLDTFLLLGDTTYNDGAETISEFRNKWAENLGTDGYLALRRSTSVMATWDDHEVTNNWDPETTPGAMVAAATRAMFDNLPLRRVSSSPDRLWKSIRWGHTAEIFVLDCRGERRPSTRTMMNAEYISRDQMDWLKAGLQASPAVFKLIMNSVPIADLPGLFDFADADRWEGYGAQRDEIVQFIDDQAIGGVLWLAGDIHLAYRGRLAASGPGSTQLEVLAGPGAQVPNPLSAALRSRPMQFDWASGVNNYLVLHLDPAGRTVRTVHHDRSDAIIADHTYTL